MVEAYHTLQLFSGKIISPNQLYQEHFLSGLKGAITEVKTKNYSEVKSFEEFIGLTKDTKE